MSYARFAPLKPPLLRALLIVALPSACAVGVKPEVEDTGGTGQTSDTAGSSTGGMLVAAGGSGTVLPDAGTTSTAGTAVSNPFGGTSSHGGTGSAGSAGTASGGQAAGGKGGTGAGGASGGTAGASTGGSGGAAAGGAGSGCACPKTLTWADNTVLNWKTGDCLDVAGAKYLYTGTIAQTYANGQCNPTKQEPWCTDSGNDYKFMLCK